MIDTEKLKTSRLTAEEFRAELINSLEVLQILEDTALPSMSMQEQIDVAKIELDVMTALFYLDNASEG